MLPDGRCSCSDPTCKDAGKHPAIHWGAKSLPGGTAIPIPPGYGVGLATGERSGVVVLDLDRKNGVDGLAALQVLGAVPPTLASATPTGGYHLLFEWPGFKVSNSASALGPGIDVRGDGGYIVLPPSWHKCGGQYAWLDPDAPIVPCPDWLRQLLLHPPKTSKRVTRTHLEKIAKRWAKAKSLGVQELGAALLAVATGVSFAEEGERDTTLFKLARELAREIPDADPGALAELFGQSLEVMPGGPSVDGVVEKFTRAVAELGGVGRPEVYITDDLPKMIDAAEAAVGRAGDVYASGGVLVRASVDRIAAVPRAAVREACSKGARWMRGEGTGDLPPPEVVDGLMARAAWPSLRPLLGLAEVPILRPDGSVIDAPGYDASTGVLFHPRRATPRVPDAPTKADAAAAVRVLVDLVDQFAWEKPEHLTGWLAAAITPLARNAYEGPAPLFLFDATTAGSGKSLLARLAAVVGTGRIGATAPWPGEEEERRKAITTYALEGNRVVCWDNVTGRLGGKSLCIALTEPVWTDRVLGASKQWSGPMRITFYATANNVELGADMDRRVVHVRLNPGIERPEERTGWKYPDVLSHAQTDQPRFTAAALTVLKAYLTSGVRVGFSPWGSYESWSEIVIGALVWAGLTDPGGARVQLREADPEVEYMRTMVREWGKVFPNGVTVRDSVNELWPERAWEAKHLELSTAIEALLYLKEGERPSAHKVGNLLRRLRGRVLDGRALEGRSARSGITTWTAR